MKLVKPEQTEHYIEKLADVLGGKSNATHKHARVNGLKVVVTDTAPTVNDESVLTLVVDTEHVPDVGGLTVETVGYVTKIFSYQALLDFPEAHYTMQAYLDDEPVEALYQVEMGSKPDVIVPYTSENTFDTFVGSGVKVRVKHDDYEKLFDISFVDPDSGVKSSRTPNLDFSDDTKTSGFFKSSGEYISGAITYEEASEGMRLVWHWKDGFDGSDFSAMLVERVFDMDGSLSNIANVDEMLNHSIKEARGNAILTPTEAYFDINETFTEDDISISAVYLMSATANDGTEYYALLGQSIKDLPSTEHFSSHVTRCAINQTYGGKEDTDNALTKTTSTSGSRCYFRFEVDVEFTYDIEIRLTDNSGTPLKSSTKVPFYSCPEVITLSAGDKLIAQYCSHKLATAGTYYVIANITGVGTDYEQSRVIELTVT